MIVVYAAVDDHVAASQICSGRIGFDVITADGLPYVIEREADPEPRSVAAGLVAHDAFIRELMTACTVVPFRLGTVARDEREFEDKMHGRAEDMGDLLKRFRGRVELDLWVRLSAPLGKAGAEFESRRQRPPAGRNYLRALASRQAAAEAPMELHHALAPFAVAGTVTERTGRVMRAAYLVETSEVESFRLALADLVAANRFENRDIDTVTFDDASLTGPWAPYTFAAQAIPGGAGGDQDAVREVASR